MTITTLAEADRTTLADIIERVGHLLPAQGPISVFIHHNTLHAFEDRPFEEAVADAADVFACEPFLAEDAYRAEFATGRITDADLRASIVEVLGPERRDQSIAGLTTRGDLWFVLARYGIPELRGATLCWTLDELDALDRFRRDVPVAVGAMRATVRGLEGGDEAESTFVRALWAACERATHSLERPSPPSPHRSARRHRDFIWAATAVDIDAWVDPVLIRFLGAYLDQGLALWPMQARERGMYAVFLECYGQRLARLCGPWGKRLVSLLAEESAAGRTAEASVAHSLASLGVPAEESFAYLLDTALTLRGWAGMVRQIEQRPDRVPVEPVPATLVDFFAIRLLLERAAQLQAIERLPLPRPSLRSLRTELTARERSPELDEEQRTWSWFNVAQLLGFDPVRVEQLEATDRVTLEGEWLAFDGLLRRKVLHLAFERQLRHQLFDALAQHTPHPSARSPSFQAIFCIDEREESLRRHLEEVDPEVETLSTAGFFGVAMYYKRSTDARARPLAPIAIRPRHYVESAGPTQGVVAAWSHHLAVQRAQVIHFGSRGLFRGALLSVLGTLALVPLFARVLLPRTRNLVVRSHSGDPHGPLMLHRKDSSPPVGEINGYTVDEMATIVKGVLVDVGVVAEASSSIVLVLGHASDSLNNPHRSAYDCGACGGSPGGTNARAFAQMANDSEVRRALAEQGFVLPAKTWFVGGEHNTADDSIDYFDLDRMPSARHDDFVHARDAMRHACACNAEERSRRFANVPSLTPTRALQHVRGRRVDLAEPRPEYNHATNAFCVVGRRTTTRGLFLDRRAFLVSYDSAADDASGSMLTRVLRAVVPVVAGINLEYLFGTIDNVHYGSGTKLPHNVTGLIGVMDGAQSDLRTGLWAQTVEIHEPVRLTLVVETSRSRLQGVLDTSPQLQQWVTHRWIFAACLEGSVLWELRADGFHEYEPELPLRTVPGPSSQWFRGRRGHLPIVAIQSPSVEVLR